jgi:pyruvate/2-oxoglutarate dehydrogenase complex dihydrolipoamide acyltransferase (E2) component
MALVEVKVPDIGDFKEVEVIELLVKPGDTVKVEQSLLTVESDKASMEIPSSHAGVGEVGGQGGRGVDGIGVGGGGG